jgi:hypothetical protein
MAPWCAVRIGEPLLVLLPQLDSTFGGNEDALINTVANTCVWLSWTVNLLVAEWWLRPVAAPGSVGKESIGTNAALRWSRSPAMSPTTAHRDLNSAEHAARGGDVAAGQCGVLLRGIDSSAVGIKALSRCCDSARGRLIEYLLTRRFMLGKMLRD